MLSHSEFGIRNSEFRCYRGFSLTEVLVGVAVLVLGFLPVYMFLFSSEKSAVESQHQVEALMHAQGVLDGVCALPWNALPERMEPTPIAEAAAILRMNEGRLPLPDGDAAKRFAIQLEILPGEDSRRVRVHITDRGLEDRSDGKRGTRILETLVTP